MFTLNKDDATWHSIGGIHGEYIYRSKAQPGYIWYSSRETTPPNKTQVGRSEKNLSLEWGGNTEQA